MRRSLRYAFLALPLCAASLISCAPAATGQHADSNRNVITAADIDEFPDMPIELIIQRKIPGVSAHNVNGVLVLQIRGATTMSREVDMPAQANPGPPLYVVNGMRMQGGSSGEMPSIPPRDIAMIKVLKGADAALYGMDGANGVIEITTKTH